MAVRIGLIFLIGLGLGILGYAGYRGDLSWSSSVAPESEGQPDAASAPLAEKQANEPASLPKLPISLNHYENRRGRGYIVQIHNQSQKHLAVLVEFENPTLEQEQQGALQLAPGEIREIGEAQGWTFVSGETIRVKQKGYQTASLTIP